MGLSKIFADYSQIHLLDEGSVQDPGDVWEENCVRDKLGVSRDLLVVGTEVSVCVSVSYEFADSEPIDDSSGFDHVVEASIEALSGIIVLMGPTDYFVESLRIPVPPGWVRMRASRSNIYKASLADVDSDQSPETMECVRIQLWSAAKSDPVVIKRWQA